jgi:hypothetical protein
LPGAIAQGFNTHPHLEGAPERETQKTDQDVRLDPFSFLVEDRPQAQITFANAKGVFGLAQLDVPAPELGRSSSCGRSFPIAEPLRL